MQEKIKDDTISRQAALDAISCNITVTGRQNAELVATTIGTFADRIKALPSAQPEPQWIPCSERMPEKNGIYFVSYEDADTWLLEWFNGNGSFIHLTQQEKKQKLSLRGCRSRSHTRKGGKNERDECIT